MTEKNVSPPFSGLKIVRKTLAEFFQEPSFFHGAALAYYAIFALIPLIYLAISSFGQIIGKEEMIKIIDSLLKENVGLKDTSGILSFLTDIEIAKGNLMMTIIGFFTLLLTSSALLNTLRVSINEFYDVKIEIKNKRKRIQYNLGTKLISILFLPVFGVVMLMAYFGETILMAILNQLFGELNSFENVILRICVFFFSIFTYSLLFTVVLKYVNDGCVRWKSALYGALVTSVLLYLGQLLINYYLSNYFFGSKAGVAGTLLVLMAWIYYSSQIIFIGAKFTKIYSQAIGFPIRFESRRSFKSLRKNVAAKYNSEEKQTE